MHKAAALSILGTHALSVLGCYSFFLIQFIKNSRGLIMEIAHIFATQILLDAVLAVTPFPISFPIKIFEMGLISFGCL